MNAEEYNRLGERLATELNARHTCFQFYVLAYSEVREWSAFDPGSTRMWLEGLHVRGRIRINHQIATVATYVLVALVADTALLQTVADMTLRNAANGLADLISERGAGDKASLISRVQPRETT